MKPGFRMLAVALLFLSVQSTGAFAADTGGYVGLSLGKTKIKDFCEDATTCDEPSVTWKILAGYRVNANIAVEASYYDLGRARASGSGVDGSVTFTGNVSTDSWGIGLDVVGSLPLGDKFSVFGKLGAAHTSIDATFSGSGTVNGQPFSGTFSGKDSGINFKFGLGASYEVIDKVSVRLEWERFKDAGGDFESDIDFVSLGLTYRF